MTRRPGVTPLLLGLNLALLLALAIAWLAPGRLAQWRTWQAPAPQAPSLADVDAALLVANPAAVAVYPAVLQRPLMDPTRRPRAAASGPASAPPPNPIEKLRLQGIVAGPALNGVLIDEDGQSRFVRRGERVGDWVLDSLGAREAVFARGGERRRIELPFTLGGSAGAAGRSPVSVPAPQTQASPLPPSSPDQQPSPPAPSAADSPSATPTASGGAEPSARPASAPR